MNYLSEVKSVFRHAFRLQSTTRIAILNYSTKDTASAAAPTQPVKDDEVYNEDELGKQEVAELLSTEDLDAEEREREIERKRNKSRLKRTQRNFLFHLPLPLEDLRTTVTLYQSRKQYALHGAVTGLDPRICFYTPAEMDDRTEYDRVKYPLTIQELMENVKREKAEKAKAIREREDKIAANLTKLDKWKADLTARMTKKEKEARLAKVKREQLLEDIRQEIGFKIDFRDPRFNALMEKKELDAKKAKKAEKKKKQEELLVARVKEQAETAMAAATQSKQSKTSPDDDDEEDTVEQVKTDKKAVKPKNAAAKKKSKDESDSSDSDSDSDDETGSKKK